MSVRKEVGRLPGIERARKTVYLTLTYVFVTYSYLSLTRYANQTLYHSRHSLHIPMKVGVTYYAISPPLPSRQSQCTCEQVRQDLIGCFFGSRIVTCKGHDEKCNYLKS